jgi:hypothetical protein
MTGFIVRVHRNGVLTTLEIEDLMDAEWVNFVRAKTNGSTDPRVLEGWRLARALAVWIREHRKELNADCG